MDLLRHGKPIWDIQKLDAQSYQKLYGAPKLDDVRFSTRTLIEGLIAHGILKPGDLPGLFQALKTHAPVPAFQDRILESLYKEEMIRNVQGVVRGESMIWPVLICVGKAAYLRRTPHSVLAHLVMIRAVLVTPTRILIGPPQQEPSNSVTRRYNDKLDGIIRVQFADEEDRLYVRARKGNMLS